MTSIKPIVLAGAAGDLGARIATALGERQQPFRALVRSGLSTASATALTATGAELIEVDYDDAPALRRACDGASCVVSALNGLEPVIIGTQGKLLDAAVATGVPRFVPSDYSLDFTKTRPGDNRNLDLRRRFMAHVDTQPIAATSVLNGAFADLLAGQAPIVLHQRHKILHWGNTDQKLDFTTKDDVAAYVAAVASAEESPRILRIAGASVSPRDLARIMTELTGHKFGLWRPGGIGLLSLIIRIARTVSPAGEAVFPVWQGMQYMRDMFSGRGQLTSLDNDRYGVRKWQSAADVLESTVR